MSVCPRVSLSGGAALPIASSRLVSSCLVSSRFFFFLLVSSPRFRWLSLLVVSRFRLVLFFVTLVSRFILLLLSGLVAFSLSHLIMLRIIPHLVSYLISSPFFRFCIISFSPRLVSSYLTFCASRFASILISSLLVLTRLVSFLLIFHFPNSTQDTERSMMSRSRGVEFWGVEATEPIFFIDLRWCLFI